jgi:hypothetical protein
VNAKTPNHPTPTWPGWNFHLFPVIRKVLLD